MSNFNKILVFSKQGNSPKQIGQTTQFEWATWSGLSQPSESIESSGTPNQFMQP